MPVNLQKGSNVNLSKEAPGVQLMQVGLGWDVRKTDGAPFDLDCSVFLLNASGKVRSDADFIFFNNLKSTCGGVVHTGDNRTGDAAGDDELIKIDFSKIPAEVDKIAFAVSIHDAKARGQNFGSVNKAYIRVSSQGGAEIARYDLSEDASTMASMIFGEVYRNGSDWKFKAIGQGFNEGLGPLADNFGVNV